MSGNNILLDTNAIIAVLDGHPIVKNILNHNILHISFIAQLESLSYQKLSVEERALIENFLGECILLELNEDSKKIAIDFRIRYQAFRKINEIELIRFI